MTMETIDNVNAAKVILILLVFLAFCSALLFWPRFASTYLLQLPKESRVWGRLIGVIGIISVGMTFVTDHRLNIVHVSYSVIAHLNFTKHILFGIIIGLFLAMYTQNKERGS